MRRDPPPVVIKPAQLADTTLFGRIHRDAFAHEVFNRRVFGDVPADTLAAHFASEQADIFPSRIVLKAVRGSTILGFLVLIPPRSPNDPPPPWREDKWPAGSKPELVAEWFSRMDLGLIERHFYLEYLAVDPVAQRQGVGRRLIEAALGLADADRLPFFLKSSQPGKALYESFGFEEFREPIVGGEEGEFVVVPMKRGARGVVA